MNDTRTIYCCGCSSDALARLTNGAEIYPHRPDLATKLFWRCARCANYVGCHQSPQSSPLGNIPTPELRKARGHIHAVIDPIWKGKRMTRGSLYKAISDKIGRQYHTAEIRTITEAREVYRVALEIIRGLPT